jgi:hypothetical protein
MLFELSVNGPLATATTIIAVNMGFCNVLQEDWDTAISFCSTAGMPDADM